MKLYNLFKWSVALVALMLILWMIPPAFAQDVGVGNVPIVFGTDADAVVGDADVVDTPTPAPVDDPAPDAFRLDVFLAILGAVGFLGFLLYMSSPPSTQKTILSALDLGKGMLQYLKDLPGERYDKQLQQALDEIDALKRRLQAYENKGDSPPQPNF